jgi:predicted acylesterase/phospholipase RssA
MSEHELRLLALDGGGVRGLSTLQILKQLMDTIDPESPPKPCDYFDMIGGTSTGGSVRIDYVAGFKADKKRRLIAIMLGRLRMTVDECIDAYVSLSDRIFQKQRHRVTIKGRVQGRFDSDELERAIKEIVARQGLAEDALLKDSRDTKCKVWVKVHLCAKLW